MKNLELLAPVGDRERLEAAVYFGADAVYFGWHAARNEGAARSDR